MFVIYPPQAVEAYICLNSRVIVIQRAWARYKYRSIFRILKDKVEHLNNNLPKKIISQFQSEELKIIRDLGDNYKIRFRLGGSQFPPQVLYKVFIDKQKVYSFHGAKLMQPGSEASVSSCKIMGKPTYFQNVKLELEYQAANNHYSSLDVSNRLEYVKYLNSLDNTPAYLGGYSNSWRVLHIKHVLGSNTCLRKPVKVKRTSVQKESIVSGIAKYKKTPRLVKKEKSSIKDQKLSRLKKLYGLMEDSHDEQEESEEEEDAEEAVDEFDKLFEWTNNLPMLEI